NGRIQPIRQEQRVVTFPRVPGTQTVALTWRERTAMAMVLASPELTLGVPSVNLETRIAMPADRWTLFAGGARLGPAVLFWPLLVVVALAAVALGRLRLTPLGARHWFLLGVGLTQVPLYVGVIVAGWLLALGWRRERGATLGDGGFDLLQVLLALWTLLALHGLFAAIQHGLLGLPDMQIAGNGSTAALLRWYHDRAGATLPRTWVVSVPLLVYRTAMLGWALWIAWAVLWWLRWCWAWLSEGGRWLRVLQVCRVGRAGLAALHAVGAGGLGEDEAVPACARQGSALPLRASRSPPVLMSPGLDLAPSSFARRACQRETARVDWPLPQ